MRQPNNKTKKRLMTKQQIGRCGELLVQVKLLLAGIESAPMTTDTGIDLVAFSNRSKRVLTIQAKTNHKPKPAGGKGKRILDWWIPDDSPADAVAFCDLSTFNVWLFKFSELPKFAQQHPKGRYHLGMYIDRTVRVKPHRKSFVHQFEKFLIEKRISQLF